MDKLYKWILGLFTYIFAFLTLLFLFLDYDLDEKTETHKKDHAAIEIPLSSDLPAGVFYLIPNHKK